MKNILFIFLLIPLISIGQDKEIVELRNEINTVKDKIIKIKYNRIVEIHKIQ